MKHLKPDETSHLTILRPRDDEFGTSSRLTTDYILEIEAVMERTKWSSRFEFMMNLLTFYIGLPALWRFPKEAFMHEKGNFVWTFIIQTLTFGCAMMFFELSMGQYSSKGFSKVFAMCPLLEGISCSMAIYCIVVSTYYNVLNTFSFVYAVTSLNNTLEFKHCGGFTSNECEKNATLQTFSPEYLFYNYRVIYYSPINYEIPNNPSILNYRNIGVSFFLWVLVCMVILKGIRTSKLPPLILVPMVYVTFLFVILSGKDLEGFQSGVKLFFTVDFEKLFDIEVWFYSLQQVVVTQGLGMGPLIILGSYSTTEYLDHVHCYIVSCFTIVACLLSGCTYFGTLGVLAYERNQTMEIVLSECSTQEHFGMASHLIYSYLLGRLGNVEHIASFFLFFALLGCGWYSLITFTENISICCYTYLSFTSFYKIWTNLLFCLTLFGLGIFLNSRTGYIILMTMDYYLVRFGLLVVILCELIAVIYVYGLHDFTDDIDFMIGYGPWMLFQIIWVFSPIYLVVAICNYVYVYNDSKREDLEHWTVVISTLLIVMPIVIIAMYNFVDCYRNGDWKDVLNPREIIVVEPTDYPLKSKLFYSFLGNISAGPSNVPN